MKRPRIKRIVISAVTCAAIIAVGILLLSVRFNALRSSDGDALVQATVTDQQPNVAVQLVEYGAIEEYLDLTGVVQPWQQVTLSAETRGNIESRPIEEGDRVVQGQELARINTMTIRANMDQARAEFTMALQELERIRSLAESGISSPQEFDQAVSKHDAARAKLSLSEIQMDQSIIRAPFTGVIDRLEKEEGEFVDVGNALVHMVQLERIKVVTGIPERDVARFAAGDPVIMVFDAYPGEVFEGRIFRIATSAEMSTRTFATEIEVDNRRGRLKPGMISRVRLVRDTYENAITVPLFAVVPREGRRVVFVEVDGVALQRSVEVGMTQGDLAVISGGLDPGDRLIVRGHRDLREGQRVNVVSSIEPLLDEVHEDH